MSARLRLLSLGLTVAVLFAAAATLGVTSPEAIRDRVDGFGVAGPLVFVAVATALTLCFVPGPLIAGASGLLFGTALRVLTTLVATVSGASAAFAVSRWCGHAAVEELVGPRTRPLRD